MKLEFSRAVFRKILKYQISWKSVQWEPSCSTWTDRQGKKGPMAVFCTFVNASKTDYYSRSSPDNIRYKTQQSVTKGQKWTELQKTADTRNPRFGKDCHAHNHTVPHLFGIYLTTLSVCRAKQRWWRDDWWTMNWIKFEKEAVVAYRRHCYRLIDSEYIFWHS